MKSFCKLTLLTLLCCSFVVRADEKLTPEKPEKAAKPAAKSLAKQLAPGITDEQAQQALQFATEHHPELAKLLDTLKTTRKGEFQRALRELHMARTRLETLKTRQPERYSFELEIWKAGSRARLLAAQTAMDPAAEQALREDLRKTLASQYEAKQKLAEWELKELTNRVAKMDANLKKLRDSRQQDVERDLETLLRSAQQKQKALENMQVARKAKKTAAATKATATKADPDKKSVPDKKPEADQKPEANKKIDDAKK